jgi:hypothetical protein
VIRLELRSQCIVDHSTLRRNAEINAHYPRPVTRLAVVGGGPLVVHDLEELRDWKGHIWAVNRTANWLKSQGIKSTFVTIDPQVWTHEVEVDDCLVASCCDPSMFEKIKGKNVQIFDLSETHSDGVSGGVTTAVRMPSLALRMGYRDIHFFGCEGSYDGNTHICGDYGSEHEMIIRAGGKDYRTSAEFVSQCENFEMLFRTIPAFLKNRSRGLLKAMCENPDTWEVVGVSDALKKHLEEQNGPGFWDVPYKAAA